jgi:uncharacterized membrane protein required for colicin V production
MIPCGILASFTQPENIATAPAFMLWMFPLLAAIAVVYKTTKLRALLTKIFLKETLTLFGVLSGFMILAVIVLILLVWLITR